MGKFINWFAGFFQDQKKSASSKRSTLYLFCYFFYMEVNASISGAKVDQTVLYATVGVIAFCLGAITTEFIKDYFSNNKQQ